MEESLYWLYDIDQEDHVLISKTKEDVKKFFQQKIDTNQEIFPEEYYVFKRVKLDFKIKVEIGD